MNAAVLGAGPGGLAIAAELSLAGHDVTLADLPEFSDRLSAVRDQGGVRVASGWYGDRVVPVRAAESVAKAVEGAELVVLSVRAPGHRPFAEAVVPALGPGAALVFMGEGGGALVARGVLDRQGRTDVRVGETNCLPYIARLTAPGTVMADRKRGGVLFAALPATDTAELLGRLTGVWPFIEPAESVWDTVLVNYDAIDTVPVAILNAGTIEGRPGGILLWGEGATPSVVRVIEAVDGELLAIRRALGSRDGRRYRDFLIAQGLAPDAGDLYAVMRAGGIVRSVRASGSRESLLALVELEVPWSLAFASSIGRAAGVPTPVIDSLVSLAEVLLGRDVRAEGRTLEGLGLAGLDGPGLRALAAGRPGDRQGPEPPDS